MGKMDVHYSTKTIEWETPQEFFDKLNEEFWFSLDVCASSRNRKCHSWFTKVEDGLSQEWDFNVCWCNPPYGREIYDWVKKAKEEVEKGLCCTVVCLLPARTDTRWFHEIILPNAEVRFIKGRLKFGGSKHNCPFPCMLAIFR